MISSMFWVTVVMLLIAILQGWPLVRNQQWKDLVVFAVLWLVAFVYAGAIFGTLHARAIPNHTEILILLLGRVYSFLGWEGLL